MYLLLQLKKGKGNTTPAYDTQTSVERRKLFAHKISINGETVEYLHDDVNIHDYAEFEKAEQLIPEFRFSIKSKATSQLKRQDSCDVDRRSEGGGAGSSSDGQPKKARSFQDIARQVCLIEQALLKWPRRPRTRHHSSSSEDLVDTDRETDIDTDLDNVDADAASVQTDISNISGPEKINISVDAGTSEAAVNGNSNANIVSDNSIRQRASGSVSADKLRRTQDSSIVHDQDVVKHEHALVKDKSGENTETTTRQETKEDTKSEKRRKLRCPQCVVI